MGKYGNGIWGYLRGTDFAKEVRWNKGAQRFYYQMVRKKQAMKKYNQKRRGRVLYHGG